MESLNYKLRKLQEKILNTEDKIKIMIMGLGSVGTYLLDYLVSTADPRLELIVVGRNPEKLQSDVNIIRTAATIRHQLRCKIHIESNCDLGKVDTILSVFQKWNPDFIVNTSRVYAGLKYGSISWHNLRAYGIWTPLAVKYAGNIMKAYDEAGISAICINTSYSDAVNPWLKASGLTTFDFGSGNLNHLIPRMKFYISEKLDIENLNDIDISIATSHFHDVVVSKEGHSENQKLLISVKFQGKELEIDQTELLASCKILMPVDQKRNMMNASSNFEIIESILTALSQKKKLKIHSPGVFGKIGGYPVIIDGRERAEAYLDENSFSTVEMEIANRKSIYLDGIEDIQIDGLIYTNELMKKVQDKFGVQLPKIVKFDDSEKVRKILIDHIIIPSLKP